MNIIKNFRLNKSKENFKLVLETYFPKNKKCNYCGDIIHYYDSDINVSKVGNIVTLKGKTFNSSKVLDGVTYNLRICESCLSSTFKEYENKNKTRIFNQLNYITEYAFDIPRDVSEKWKRDNYAITESNLIKKHGEDIGKEMWKNYIKSQSDSNKYEYKKDKHNWTEEEYKEYNKSRSVTLNNFIKKYGEILGNKLWEQYLDKQKITKSKEYVVDNYGIEHWDILCQSKGHSYDNYVKWHGDQADIKYEEYWSNLKSKGTVSKSSQLFFNKLDILVSTKYKSYYFDKDGKEYGKNLGKRWVFLDYFISELNLCIEYNGELYHANPNKYKPDDKPMPFSNITAQEIWDNDKEKIKLLKEKFNINTIVVWENSLPDTNDLFKIIEGYDENNWL